jgi:hypothetical protein
MPKHVVYCDTSIAVELQVRAESPSQALRRSAVIFAGMSDREMLERAEIRAPLSGALRLDDMGGRHSRGQHERDAG